MDDKHIHDLNDKGAAFKDSLTEFVAVSRKQADRGEMTMTILDALLDASITSDARAQFLDLIEKLSPKQATTDEPKRSTYAPPQTRAGRLNGTDKPAGQAAAE